MYEREFFLKTHNYSVFKNRTIYYIYIYNKYFYFIIKINPCVQLRIISSKRFGLRQNLSTDLDGLGNLGKYIEQFDRYKYTKIKFAGKGYKIRKRSFHSMVLVFNKAHITTIWWRNIILKKIKKNKFYIKLTTKNQQFINTIVGVRRINVFTKKGLRTSRQTLFKKKGKKV